MNEIEDRTKVYRMLASNPEVRQLAARALEIEDENAEKEHWIGWEWHDIPYPAAKLKVLVVEGIVKIAFKSNSTTTYALPDREMIRDALNAIGEDSEGEVVDVPENLFDHIVGHGEVKYWMTKSLKAEDPVHILLVGPPATAKSLFLEAIATLQGSQYALGGSSSRAGIADFLIQFRPRFLIIDELDKMRREDMSVLLALMQSGLVARMKKGMKEVDEMTTWVMAGCNDVKKLPPELRSRFIEFTFVPYTKEEFINVVVEVLTRQHGKDPDLAAYIAEKVSRRTRDVRQAVQVAKLCDNSDEVDRFEGGIDPRRLV